MVLIKVKFAEKHFEVSASLDITVAEVRLVFRPLPLPPARVRRAVLDSLPKLREMFAVQSGVEPGSQRIIYAGRILKDSDTLRTHSSCGTCVDMLFAHSRRRLPERQLHPLGPLSSKQSRSRVPG